MIRKVIHTLGSKLFTHVLSFVIIVMTTNIFGDVGKGAISIFVFNVSFVVMLIGFIGGPSLIFLTPRYNNKHLIGISYLWAVIGAAAGTFILGSFNLINTEWMWYLLAATLLQGFSSIHMMILLGKEKVQQHNYLSVVQLLFLLAALLVFYLLRQLENPVSYIYAYLIASGVYFLLSTIVCYRAVAQHNPTATINYGRTIKLGVYNQLGNLIQLFNYRLSYYFIQKQEGLGNAAVGVFSTGIQVGEALWVVSRSVSLVQYSVISNLSDRAKSKSLTVDLIKFNLLAVVVMLVPLLLVPSTWYAFVFGDGFSEVKTTVAYLGVGIVANALSGGFSHYYSGIGKHHVSTWSSFVGLIFTVVLCVILIPEYGVKGACIASSAAYSALCLCQLIYFLKYEGGQIQEFLFNKRDLEKLRSIASGIFKK